MATAKKTARRKIESKAAVKADIVECEVGQLQGDKATQKKLVELETVFINGIATVCEMGRVLAEIRDGGYYRARGYKTFEAYVKRFFDISRTYAYRLINHNRVCNLIGKTDDVRLTESYLRQLATIHDDSAVSKIWAEAKGESEENPTISVLAEKVAAYKQKQKKARKKGKQFSCDKFLKQSKEQTSMWIFKRCMASAYPMEEDEKERILSVYQSKQEAELAKLKKKLGIK